MTLAVPNSEYWIEFSVIDQNGSSSRRCRLHNNSLSKISNGKLLIAQIDSKFQSSSYFLSVAKGKSYEVDVVRRH